MVEAAMNYLIELMEGVKDKWDIERKGSGWRVVDRLAEEDGVTGAYSRILSFEAAERRQHYCRVRDALYFQGMRTNEAERIARRESRARGRRDWRKIVREYSHCSYGDLYDKSDAQQKSNVIMFPAPPNAVARDL
jgi:hypothetical protein